MASTKRRLPAAGAGLVVSLYCAALTAAVALPSLDAADLARGRYSSAQMILKKTFLRITVAAIDVRFDKQAQSRFTELAQGKPYSDGLAEQLARVAIGAQRAVVQMQLKRDVPLNRWVGVVRDNLEQARKAGLIGADLEQRVSRGLPEWFAALRDRGYKEGDRVLYGVSPDSLRTVVVATDGQVLVDRMDREPGARSVVLASYFAPGSDFREPLLKSLLEANR